MAVNSGYSFWWDVTNDWGLSLLQSTSGDVSSLATSFPVIHGKDERLDGPLQNSWSSQHYPRGLRPVLLFNDPIVYYIAISFNLVLRLTWSLKLSSHLHSIAELESGVFLMELLELIRRWMWVFFRIEWETIRKGVGTAGDDGVIPFSNLRQAHELGGQEGNGL